MGLLGLCWSLLLPLLDGSQAVPLPVAGALTAAFAGFMGTAAAQSTQAVALEKLRPLQSSAAFLSLLTLLLPRQSNVPAGPSVALAAGWGQRLLRLRAARALWWAEAANSTLLWLLVLLPLLAWRHTKQLELALVYRPKPGGAAAAAAAAQQPKI